MSDKSGWSLFIEALIAFGTLSVAILAIWGDWIRSKLAPPKLVVESHNLRGVVTSYTNGARVIYYYLKLRNLRPWISAKNCRVLLHSVSRRGPNQRLSPAPLPVPAQFVWAPAELFPLLINITNEQIIDFGRVAENSNQFEPVLYSYANNFPGYVGPNEAARYLLEIVADGYHSVSPQVFEVGWNGTWSDNLDQMSRNLTITEVTNDT